MHRFFCALFLVGLSFLAQGQSATFTASTDARQVVVNGVFEVQYTLMNGDGRDFRPPAFDGLDIISGPSLSMSTTIVNGRRSQSRSYSYTLLATKPGKLTIQPATIRNGNALMRSNTLTIEVVEGKGGVAGSRTVPGDNDVFVLLEIDSTRAYPGQQIRLDYKLYTTVNVRNYNTLREDNYEDFFFRYVKDFTERAYLEVVDGVQYRVQTLKSLALFPQKTGTFEIQPLVVNVGIGVRDERRSFFFNTRTVPKTLTSNGTTIEVIPLPEPQPPTFTGAIGSYQMSVQVNRQQLTTDDALMLTVHIVGDGDAKRWTPPSLDYLSGQFEMYDPKIVQDKFVDAGGYMQSSKVVEYLLIPQGTGQQSFSVEFTYYDVDSSAYRMLRSRPVVVQVAQGDGASGEGVILADEMVQKDIHGLRSADRFRPAARHFIFSPAYFLLGAIPFLGLLGAVVVRRRQATFAGLDPTERKRLRAMRTALKHLRQAEERMPGDSKAFYDAISLALFGYVSSKLKIPASELTKENLEQQMQVAGITEQDRTAVMQMIHRCEMVLYAAGASENAHQATYDETVQLITRIEDALS